jgi:hypothetical protein
MHLVEDWPLDAKNLARRKRLIDYLSMEFKGLIDEVHRLKLLAHELLNAWRDTTLDILSECASDTPTLLSQLEEVYQKRQQEIEKPKPQRACLPALAHDEKPLD